MCCQDVWAESSNCTTLLCSFYLAEKKLSNAQQMFDRAKQEFQATLRPDHHCILSVMRHLGDVYSRKDLAMAEMFRQALHRLQRKINRSDKKPLEDLEYCGNSHAPWPSPREAKPVRGGWSRIPIEFGWLWDLRWARCLGNIKSHQSSRRPSREAEQAERCRRDASMSM